MSRPQGINPVAGGVLAYQQGLRTSQATPLSRDEMIKIIQEITDLEQAAASIEQQTIKTFGQIASQSQQAKAEVISAYASGLANVKGSEQIKLRGNMDMAIKLLDQLEYSNPTFTAENAKNLEALSGAGKSVMTGKTDNVTAQQYVNEYIQKYREASKDVKTGIGNDLSRIRISYDRQNKNSKDPEERIALARQAINDTQSAAMTGAMEAIAGKDEDFQRQVQDLLIENATFFTDGILRINVSEADLLTVEESRKDKIKQVEELTRDFRRVGGIGRLDDLIDAIGTTALDEIVKGGIKGMADQMKDVEFAPETRRSIQFLKDQLQASEGRMDAFDTAVAEYNSIPGVTQLRDALGMNDDITFAQYMSKVPKAFNETLLNITNQAKAQGIDVRTLDADQMRGLVARQLATGSDGEVDAGQAARLSNNQFRMRRMLATDVIQGGRQLARETARAGLGQENLERGFVAPAGAGAVDMGFAGEGIDVKEPKPKPKVDRSEEINELRTDIANLNTFLKNEEEGSPEYNKIQSEIAEKEKQLDSLVSDTPITFKPPPTAAPDAATEAAKRSQAKVAAATEKRAATEQAIAGLGQQTQQIAATLAGAGEPTGATTGETPAGAPVGFGGTKETLSAEQLADISKSIKSRFGNLSTDPSTIVAQASLAGYPGLTMKDAQGVLQNSKMNLKGVQYTGVPKAKPIAPNVALSNLFQTTSYE